VNYVDFKMHSATIKILWYDFITVYDMAKNVLIHVTLRITKLIMHG